MCTVLFWIAGAALGFMIPTISQSIVIYKCSKKHVVLVTDDRFTSVSLKLLLCILNASAWSFAGYRMENLMTALLLSILISVAVMITIIDLRMRIVPNELVLVMFIVGIAFQTMFSGLTALPLSALCMVAMVLLFSAVAGIVGFDKVGAGDVKLAGAMGLALGYPGILIAMIIMSVALLIYSLFGLLTRKLTLHSMLPFAPFMMLGMMFSLLTIIFELRLSDWATLLTVIYHL